MTKFESSLISAIEKHKNSMFRVDFDGTGFREIEFEESLHDALGINAGDWLVRVIDEDDVYDYHYEKALDYFNSYWVKGISKFELQTYVGIDLNESEMKGPSIEVDLSPEKYNFLRNTPLTEEQRNKLNTIVTNYLMSVKNGTDKESDD